MVSQSDEDWIIADIFRSIGEGRRRFVEFGSGDGRQNNTIELLKLGWSGIWFEPHKRRYLSAKARWADYPVNIVRREITPAKVNLVVKGPLDFLSIDIDGNDYAVWEAITAKPRVVCIEYARDRCTMYKNDERLKLFTALGEAKGYSFACCSASKVNAFFIRP